MAELEDVVSELQGIYYQLPAMTVDPEQLLEALGAINRSLARNNELLDALGRLLANDDAKWQGIKDA